MGQSQERVDEVGHAVDLLEHAADGLLVLVRRAALRDRRLADTAHDGKRRAELVRGIGGKAPQLVERRLEPGERLVDDGRRRPISSR